ncbi:MAG TPA: VOC family protein, partial [Candidatus Dormibacteraeota bacterium]|nr:VOC family protein [Candidatus Dormibacteraeota bacterium]
HLSFNLPDHESLLALWARLDEAGVGVTEEIDHGSVHSIYFTDPNGIALEASYWLDDVTAKKDGDRSAFCDPDPVAAVRELEAGARLDWMPATDLVSEPRGIS